jgi:DNA-binding NarL/FixJ family response regulator
MNATKRVVVIDDHPLLRERIAELVNRETDLKVVGEAEGRKEAVELIGNEKPDLAVIDLSLKDSSGLDLIKDLQAVCPETRLLVVSMQDELIYAERCVRAGASGYVTKQVASRQVIEAIRHVLSGGIWLSQAVTDRLVAQSVGRQPQRNADSVTARLTDRELQVFERTGRGHGTREIAEALGVDIKTVETYRGRIKEKLGLRDGNELLRRAIAWVYERAD